MDNGTRVITLGALHHAARGPQLEPVWDTTFGPEVPTSPAQPQNTMRPTLQNGISALRAGGFRGVEPQGEGQPAAGAPPVDRLGAPANPAANQQAQAALEIHPAVAIVSAAGAGLGAYHGYSRNRNVGWALWWALMGGVFPVVTVPIAIAQGFGRPAGP